MNPSSEQLLRLLRLIPLAARPEGIGVEEAARLCSVDPEVVEKDFRLLTERAWYLPAGRTDDFQILMHGDRIRVEAPPAFHRPIRLGLHELLAVSLALRCAGVERGEARELCLAVEAACAMDAEVASEAAGDEGVELFLRRPDSDAIHDELARAIVHRRRVRLGYLKAGAESPEERHLEPWHLLHAEGETYLLSYDLHRSAPRLFRLDRILGARQMEADCTEAVSITPGEIDAGGWVRLVADHRDDGTEEVAEVRYSPQVAPWVRERYSGEEEEDGSYLVRHHVLADDWLVRHVLRFGTEAEVLAPSRIREAVVRAVGVTPELALRSGPGA